MNMFTSLARLIRLRLLGARTAWRRPIAAGAGFSLTELLVVIALIGAVGLIVIPNWQASRRRAAVTSAARQTEAFLHQARMYAIYRGINHFVVIDPSSGTLEIYADDGSQTGVFDADDRRTAGTRLASFVSLALPEQPATILSPVGPELLDDGWFVPGPDGGGAWGSTLRGVRVTPTGRFESAQSSPQIVRNGVIVFSNSMNETSAVAIRGRLGLVSSFELFDGSWREL